MQLKFDLVHFEVHDLSLSLKFIFVQLDDIVKAGFFHVKRLRHRISFASFKFNVYLLPQASN